MELSDASHLLRVAMRNPKQRTMGAKPVVELDTDVAVAILRAVEAAMDEPEQSPSEFRETSERASEAVSRWPNWKREQYRVGPRPQGGRA